jgi:hypothetical protein
VTVALYADENVSGPIIDGLHRRNIDLLTTIANGRAALEDELLLVRATALGRVLLTQDQDFLTIGRRWLREGRSFAGLIYAPQVGLTIGGAVEYLEAFALAMEPSECRNQTFFVPRRV